MFSKVDALGLRHDIAVQCNKGVRQHVRYLPANGRKPINHPHYQLRLDGVYD